jgi:poly-gamma-glutamate synthesis protein (capsule biosynthesis protein)
MMHAGAEYTRAPTKLQRDFAQQAIDVWADIVVGAHPHWTQWIESYKGKYIFYSLGNFIFDQEFSHETKTWLTVHISLKKESDITSIENISLHPILIENYGQPRLLEGAEKKKALQDIGQKEDFLNIDFTI